MQVTNVIVITYDAPDNDALDRFDEDTHRLVETIVDNSGGIYTAEATRRATLVPAFTRTNQSQLQYVIDEIQECLENTPIDYRHGTTIEVRQALISFLGDLGVEDLPKV